MLKKTKKDFFNKIALKDHKTLHHYEERIAVWEKFIGERMGDPEYIPKEKDESIELLQLFVNWYSIEAWNHRRKRKGHSPNAVWNYASSVRKYLFYRGSPLTKDDVQEHIELPAKINKELHGLNLSEIQSILNSLRFVDKVCFMCQLSGGFRIGELVQLKKKHLVLDKERIIVKIPPSIAKFKKGRTTFVSKEAGNLLKTIIKNKNDDDLIFTTNKDVHGAETQKGGTLRSHLTKLGLDMKYEDTGNYMINTHSFRAYFITKISRHDPNLAKLLAGEKGYLLQYDRMDDDEKLENYLEFEKDLLVFDLARKDEEIKKLKVANTAIADLKEKQLESDKKIALLEEFLFRAKPV